MFFMFTDENVLRMHVHGLTHRAASETDPQIRGGLPLVTSTISLCSHSLTVGTHQWRWLTGRTRFEHDGSTGLARKNGCYLLLRCSRHCKPDPRQFLLSGPSEVLALDPHNKPLERFRTTRRTSIAIRRRTTSRQFVMHRYRGNITDTGSQNKLGIRMDGR